MGKMPQARVGLEVLHQVFDAYTQSQGDVEQVHDGNVSDAALNAGDVCPMQIGLLGQFFLCQAEGKPPLANCSAKRFSGIGDVAGHAPMFFFLSARVHSI